MKIRDLVGRGLTPYFKIFVPKPTAKNQKAPPAIPLISSADIRNKIYSLKVEDKEGCPPMVTLTLMDDTGRFNKRFSHGIKFSVEWGLKQGSAEIFSRLTKPQSKTVSEIRGTYRRGPMPCSVINYSVSGADGIAMSSLTLRAGDRAGYTRRTRRFESSPKTIIQTLAQELGFSSVVDFPEMGTILTGRNSIMQNNESNYSFLRRLSYKFNCKFVTQSDPMTLYFVAWARDPEIDYAEAREGVSGKVWLLDYGSAESTIISFSIEANSGSTNGSTISLVEVDGQTHASFSPSPTESTTIWELDTEKIKKAAGGPDGAALLGEVLAAGSEDLDRLKLLYFKKKTSTTAPETGGGYTAKMKIVPNPDMQAGDRIFLGSKASLIPPQFKSRFKTEPVFSPIAKPGIPDPKTLWRITSISQAIDSSNYSFDIEAAR